MLINQPTISPTLFILDRWQCKAYGASLHQCPEHERGATIVRCISCGAKNIVAATYQIIGWRE